MPDRICKINEQLYISDITAVNSLSQIKKHSIQCILSLIPNAIGKEVLDAVECREEVSFSDHPFEEVPFGRIEKIFDRWKGKRILVHCYAGISRSAIICAFWIALNNKKNNEVVDVEQIIGNLRTCRPRVNPNYGFVIQLLLRMSQTSGSTPA